MEVLANQERTSLLVGIGSLKTTSVLQLEQIVWRPREIYCGSRKSMGVKRGFDWK